jgi:hypothetical protein
MKLPTLTRRRFIYLSLAGGVLGGAGFGVTRTVHRVREAAARMTSQ